MNRKKQFELLSINHGIIIDYENLEVTGNQKLLDQFQFYNALDETIYTGIVGNNNFNAVATKIGNEEYIIIYSGAITRMTLFAYQILSDPTILPAVGNIANESIDMEIYNLIKEDKIDEAILKRIKPICKIRINAAERISECACLILYYHEAAHIAGCHLDIIQNDLGNSAHEEFNINQINEQESLLLRSLELEADTLGMVNALNMWRILEEKSGNHEVAGLNPTEVWLLAADLLFCVMSNSHIRARSGRLSSHPSMITRYGNIRFGKIMYKENDKELLETLKKSNMNLINWFVKNDFNNPNQVEFFDHDSFSHETAEWQELLTNLETIYPRIDNFIKIRESKKYGDASA